MEKYADKFLKNERNNDRKQLRIALKMRAKTGVSGVKNP